MPVSTFPLLRTVFGAAVLALVSACSTAPAPVVVTKTPTPPAPPPPEPTSAYLFAHFTGESADGEQIYFAVSEDGFHWTDLNNSAPVLRSTVGDQGVRDPSLIRSPDGKKVYLLATDLRIATGRGWDAARFRGSRSLVFWESTDLVNWSEPWMVDVASAIPEAGCAWAPEAIYDAEAGAYFVYWATISPLNGVREARIYGAHTKDFRTFTAPQLYIERAGEGVFGGDIIDTQIIEVQGAKRRFYRTSRDTQITLEAADSLHGTWDRIGDLAHFGFTGRQVEGPILFQLNQQARWGLMVDQYAAARGYLPLLSSDLDAPRGFGIPPASAYSLGTSRKRHGGILNITATELAALRAQWPSQPAVRLASLADPTRFVRHYDYRPRLDNNVTPAEDGLWRLVPGLTGAAGTVSLRSVNFPDRHLALTAAGLSVEVVAAHAATTATFIRVPGLADPSATSFRLLGSAEHYLLAQGTSLSVGPASTELERRRATFTVKE